MYWSGVADKLQKHEACARSLLDRMVDQISQTRASDLAVPVRRHLAKKASGETAAASQEGASAAILPSGSAALHPFTGQDEYVAMHVIYSYKLDGIRSRRYAESYSVQHLGTAWQSVALCDTLDFDIENSCFTLLVQLLDRMEPQHPAWPKIRETLQMCAKKRTEIIQTKQKLDKTVFNGGGIPSHLEKNEFLHDLQRASLFCRWVAATALNDLAWASVLQAKERPDLSILTHFWNIAEDIVMEAWLAKAATLGSQHTSLHFDGIRLDRQVAQPSVDEFCESCARTIREKTGFSVQIRVKEHYNFKTLLGKLDSKETVACPEILLKHGNCILASLHHLGFAEQAGSMASTVVGPAHVFFARRGCRTYEQVKDSAGLRLFPRLPRRELKPGEKILLHLASGGKPHCVAAEVTADGVVQITDGAERVAASLADMWRMCSAQRFQKPLNPFKEGYDKDN